MFPYISKSVLLIMCLSVFSCKHKNPVSSIDQTKKPRPIGIPVAHAIIKTLGNRGGTIVSEDGKLEVEIPAGALTKDIAISIQPIQNTAAGGVGFGYRLLPHGDIFKKRVSLHFHYENELQRLSNKEAITIAFQNEKGIWSCVGHSENDTLSNTISVQTEHFSDWAIIPSLELSPVVQTIGVGESITLKAQKYVFPVGEDLIVQLGTANSANGGVPEKIDPKYIVRWTLYGPGNLSQNGAEAIYTAPSSMQAEKKATVVCELKVKNMPVLLISTIYLINEGITLSVDGSEWKTYPAMAISMPALNQYHLGSLRTSPDVPEIVFQWPMITGKKSNGIYDWNMLGEEENHVAFEFAEETLQQMYVSAYDDGMGNHDSPGFLSVEEKEKSGKKFITGVFILDKAALVDNNTGSQKKISRITGTFKVQRNW